MEQDFIIGLRANLPKVQSAFVNKYGPRVHAFILGMIGSQNEAEELTVDVFVRAFQHIYSYDSNKATIDTWLLRIAHNIAISHLRHPRLSISSLDNGNYDEKPQIDTDDSPMIEFLQQAISDLPPDDRAIILLHYYDGAKLAEIAHILGNTEGAVTVKLHRIRLKLKKLIESKYGRQGF